MSLYKITDNYFISGQLAPADMPQLAQMGIKSVICNRPDHESSAQPTFNEIEAAATQAGLTATHNPVSPVPPTLDAAKKQAEAISAVDGPVLAFCASGNRSANLWNMCEANKLL